MSLRNSFIFSVISLFTVGCKCDSYFSNSNQKYLEERYFNIECHIVPTVVQAENDKVEITLSYKHISSQKVIKSTLKILPIIYETGDTLKFLSEYASVYTFDSKNELESRLNLALSFNIDSAGVVIPKIISFKKLKKIRKCRFRPVLH